MDRPTETSLVIKEHDFQTAKDSLKQYTERAKKEIQIRSVRTRGGFLNLGDHTVKGHELNEITSQIESYLIDIGEFNQGLVDEFNQVYKAFESLDKDYISGIVRSIQTAEKVSLDEQKDRRDIKELVHNLDIAVKALKKFKSDIEQLKHLMDIDVTYELLERQEKLVKTLNDYKNELSALKHLKDVDQLWEATESQGNLLENINRQLDSTRELIEAQGDTISEFTAFANELDQKYQSFIGITNKALDEKQAAIDRRLDGYEESIQRGFVDLHTSVTMAKEEQNKKIDNLFTVQADKLSSIEKAQIGKLEQIAETQSETLSLMEKEQATQLAQISNMQTERLEQVSREQVKWLETTTKSLEEEKASLKENIFTLTQKVKTAYMVAGGVGAVTVLHMALNIFGVL